MRRRWVMPVGKLLDPVFQNQNAESVRRELSGFGIFSLAFLRSWACTSILTQHVSKLGGSL
jgi:hypothetical protein